MTLVPRQCEQTRSWNLRGNGMHRSNEICKLGNKAGNANVISCIFNKLRSFWQTNIEKSKPFYLTFETSNFLTRVGFFSFLPILLIDFYIMIK